MLFIVIKDCTKETRREDRLDMQGGSDSLFQHQLVLIWSNAGKWRWRADQDTWNYYSSKYTAGICPAWSYEKTPVRIQSRDSGQNIDSNAKIDLKNHSRCSPADISSEGHFIEDALTGDENCRGKHFHASTPATAVARVRLTFIRQSVQHTSTQTQGRADQIFVAKGHCHLVFWPNLKNSWANMTKNFI